MQRARQGSEGESGESRIPSEPPRRRTKNNDRPEITQNSERAGQENGVDSELHSRGDDHRPKEIRVPLDPLSNIENEAAAAREILSISKGNERIVHDPAILDRPHQPEDECESEKDLRCAERVEVGPNGIPPRNGREAGSRGCGSIPHAIGPIAVIPKAS